MELLVSNKYSSIYKIWTSKKFNNKFLLKTKLLVQKIFLLLINTKQQLLDMENKIKILSSKSEYFNKNNREKYNKFFLILRNNNN